MMSTWKMTSDGRRLSIEDFLQSKKTFDGRRCSMEDDVQWKTIFNGRSCLMEDSIWWKTHLMEDYVWWRQSSMEDSLQCKRTFGGRKHSFRNRGFLNWSLTQKTKDYFDHLYNFLFRLRYLRESHKGPLVPKCYSPSPNTRKAEETKCWTVCATKSSCICSQQNFYTGRLFSLEPKHKL